MAVWTDFVNIPGTSTRDYPGWAPSTSSEGLTEPSWHAPTPVPVQPFHDRIRLEPQKGYRKTRDYPKNPWALHGRGRALHSRGLGPQNPICLRARTLRVQTSFQTRSTSHRPFEGRERRTSLDRAEWRPRRPDRTVRRRDDRGRWTWVVRAPASTAAEACWMSRQARTGEEELLLRGG